MAFLSISEVKKIISPDALQNVREKNSKYYFVEVPENIRPVVDASPTDKHKWATLRRYCYEFMKAEVPQQQGDLLFLTSTLSLTHALILETNLIFQH